MNPSAVPLTFPWHRLQHWSQNLLLTLFLSASQRFAEACFLGFLSEEQETCETEVWNTVGTPNSPVFSRVVFKKSEMLSWSGSLMGVVPPSTEVVLSGCLGSTCGVRGIGQVAKLLGARAEVRMSCAFRTGKHRQESRGRQSREGGLEVTVREQQGMEGETWEWRRRDGDQRHAHATNLFTTLSRACVCTRKKMCGDKMCVMWLCKRCVQKHVRATGECVYNL